jgi:hypothetical protein
LRTTYLTLGNNCAGVKRPHRAPQYRIAMSFIAAGASLFKAESWSSGGHTTSPALGCRTGGVPSTVRVLGAAENNGRAPVTKRGLRPRLIGHFASVSRAGVPVPAAGPSSPAP